MRERVAKAMEELRERCKGCKSDGRSCRIDVGGVGGKTKPHELQ